MDKIKVALIGYGMAGRFFHLPPLLDHESYVVKYIMTNNPKTIHELNEKYPYIKIIREIDDALNDKEIDLIVIATPNDVHSSYTKKALLKGKHVVCEKPFVETLDEAKSLFKIAQQKNLLLRVFHNRQYDGDVLTVHDLVEKKTFGKILVFTTRFDTFNPIVFGAWREKAGVMPGVFYDLAPHLIDHALRLFGLPKSLQMKLFSDRPDSVVDDHFEMILYYDNLVCYLGAEKLARNPLPRFQVIGTEASYYKYGYDQPDVNYQHLRNMYQTSGLRSELYKTPQDKIDIPILIGKHYEFYDKFARDIKKKPVKDQDQTFALMVIGLMEYAQMSNEKQMIVEIPESLKLL